MIADSGGVQVQELALSNSRILASVAAAAPVAGRALWRRAGPGSPALSASVAATA